MQEFQEGATSYTLQEVCAECEVPSHVLVYWSDFFEVLKDEDGHLKSAFTPEELALIRKVKKCLYTQCMTVVEAKKALADDVKAVEEARLSATVAPEAQEADGQATEEALSSTEERNEEALEESQCSEESADVVALEESHPEVDAPPVPEAQAEELPHAKSLADVLEGNLSELEAVVATQKDRFEERLSEQRSEFSAVESECAARVSDLSSDLTEALEKTRRLEELLSRTLKDLEAFRTAAYGDK